MLDLNECLEIKWKTMSAHQKAKIKSFYKLHLMVVHKEYDPMDGLYVALTFDDKIDTDLIPLNEMQQIEIEVLGKIL